MKSQERRDDETVTIVTALLMLLLVAVTGAFVLVLTNLVLQLGDHTLTILGYAVLAGAVVASARYLYLQRG